MKNKTFAAQLKTARETASIEDAQSCCVFMFFNPEN